MMSLLRNRLHLLMLFSAALLLPLNYKVTLPMIFTASKEADAFQPPTNNDNANSLARIQSFGFFRDITDMQWRQAQQIHARAFPDYYEPHKLTRNAHTIHDRGNSSARARAAYWNGYNFQEEFHCLHAERIPATSAADGPKWVCDPHRIAQQESCLIYSIGSNGNVLFEKGIRETIGSHCEVHTFDMITHKNGKDFAQKLAPYATFHPWGLGTEAQADSGKYIIKTLAQTVKELGHEGRTIDIFKIDCEWCEWWTYTDWLAAPVNMRQILVQTHDAPMPEAMDFHFALHDAGYVIFSKEANYMNEAHGVEFGFLKLSTNFFINDTMYNKMEDVNRVDKKDEMEPKVTAKLKESATTTKAKIVSTKRELLLPESHFGLGNQMSCLNLAAILAVQYNRTLVVPKNGVARNPYHGMFSIPFERIYNVDRALRDIRIRFDDDDSQWGRPETWQLGGVKGRHIPERCKNNSIVPNTRKIWSDTLRSDPFPDEECLALPCNSIRIRFVAPPDIFPHVDKVYFRLNHVYEKAAAKVISSIKARVQGDKKKGKYKSPFRLLSLHVRRGDRDTVPLFDCSNDLGDLYPYTVVDTKGNYSSACSSRHPRKEDLGDILTWEHFFEHMAEPDCKKGDFPVCAADFDAMFVATNDPVWVRNQPTMSKLPPVFLIGDFPSIHKKYLLPQTLKSKKIERAPEMLLIEEMIMVESDYHVPSFETTISQQTLRLRLDYHPNERNKHLLDTYYDHKAREQKKLFPEENK